MNAWDRSAPPRVRSTSHGEQPDNSVAVGTDSALGRIRHVGTGPPGADALTPFLYTPTQAADLLAIKESWLRRMAGRRAIPCTFLGKHLRFSEHDLRSIVASGAQGVEKTRGRRHK
jgi:excisionase family DNA binding protein